jgi:lysylphosphatidylglycerol synthetase-like protein (DUF2156 family)
MNTIDDALAIAGHEWRACGVARRDRASLAADLRLDLQAAAADGVTPQQLLGSDLRGFARRLADEAAVRQVPHEYPRLLLTAFVGAVVGAMLGYVIVLWVYTLLVASFDLPRGFHVPVLLAVLLYYGSAAAIVVGGAVAAVRIHLREVPQIRSTAAAMGVLLPAAGVALTPIAIGIARASDYTASFPVIFAEMTLVIAALAGAVVLARRWALRDLGQVAPLPQ